MTSPARRRLGPVLSALLVLILLVVLALWLWPGHVPVPKPKPKKGPFDYIAWEANQLGKDADQIIAFVREKVRPEAYAGSLRGPVGTLWSGAGNQTDRADLLAALLRAAGRKARLAGRGPRVWAQVQEEGVWRDVRIAPDPAASAVPDAPVAMPGRPAAAALDSPATAPAGAARAEWTGDGPPEAARHRLTLTLRLTGKGVSQEESVTLATADLTGGAILAALEDKACVLLRSDGAKTKEFLRLATGAADDEELLLVLTHQPPAGAKPHVVTRELYSRKYKGVRSLDAPGTRHAMVIACGAVPAWVLRRESDLLREKRKALPTDTDRQNTMMALTHLARSDEALAKLREHFKVRAYVTRPRVIIASTFPGHDESEPSYRALDLRVNRVHTVGDRKKALALTVTRSALEGQLEARVLAEASGGSAGGVVSGLGVVAKYMGRYSPSTPQRLRFYESSLEHVLRHREEGAELVFSLDDDRQIVLVRGAKAELTVQSISKALARRIGSELPKALRSGLLFGTAETRPAIAAKDVPQAAMELESLLGPLAGSDVDYQPKVDVRESTERVLLTDSRIFYYRNVGDPPKRKLTLEFQILSTEGDVRHDVVDYWDETGQRSGRWSFTFRIPAKSLESSDLLSHSYSQGLYDKGNMFLMASRKVHRELTEQGWTIIRYMYANSTPSEPIKLYLVDRKKQEVWVNNRRRELPFLYAAGGYVKDNLPKQTWEKCKPIKANGRWLMNKWVILDNARFPLIGLNDAHLQTAMPGRVTSKVGGYGVPDAKVHVEGTSSTTTSWGDGRFFLPLLKKRFDKRTVTVTHPDYEPLKVEVDFTKEDALPLKLQLTPAPPKDRYVWATAADAATKLKKVDTSDHVRELIRRALADEPNLVAVVPTRPVPLGPGRLHAWMLLDPTDGQITGVTEDGLHGASMAMGMAVRKARGGAVSAYAGYISAWYVYSAGRLDAISRMMKGETFDDLGHAHAIAFAMDWLRGMESVMGGAAGLAMGGATGYSREAFRAGFLQGLAFFEQHPEYRGE